MLDLLFYTFTFIVFIQLIYYGFIFAKFAFAKNKNPKQKNIAISVIICAKNEADNLQQFLPSVIDQEYPEFEIILVNDGSNDNTLEIMEQYATKYQQIKIVNVKPIEAFWGNKKYAITLGIKAASNTFLLFTNADCNPLSRNWIKEMSCHFSNTKSLVIGYGAYKKRKYSLLNKLIRFDTLLTAIQYFSYTKLGIPYMAVGRNLAYRKEEFFKANGFMSHMAVRSGDDDLFVNQIANSKNTEICFTKDSFTEAQPVTSYKNWINLKRQKTSTVEHYKTKHKFLLRLFYMSQLLFWSLGIALILVLFKWKIVISLVAIRFLFQYISIGKSAKKLSETDTLIILPLLELFLILSQLVIFITNLTSKPHHWK